MQAEAQQGSPSRPSPSPGGCSFTSSRLHHMIAEKEKELASLKLESLQELEQQLQQREEEVRSLQAQLGRLQRDFEYNLQLLEGRDADLAACEAALQKAAGGAEQKDALVAAMQQAIGEAEAALLGEHEGRMRAEAALKQQRRALIQELAEARSAAARELERAQCEASAKCSDLEGRLEAQQRQLAGELEQARAQHAQQAAELQAQHAKRVGELELRIAVLEQLGRQREEDLKQAQQDLKAQTSIAATAAARLEDLQREAKNLASKADSMQHAHKAELAKQQREREALAQQLQSQQQDCEDLQRRVEALQAAAAEERAGSAVESSKAQAAQHARLQALEAQLAESTEENARLHGELEEARAALEMQHGVLQEQLQRILGDKDAQIQALQHALEEQQRQFDTELEQQAVDADADKRELESLSGQLAALEAYTRQQGDELAQYKESLAAAVAHCEKQQAAACSLEEWEGMLRRVTLQRDEAQSASKDAQAKLALREMELRQLKQQLDAALQRQAGAAEAGSADWLAMAEDSCSLPGLGLGVERGPAESQHMAQELLAQRRALEAAQAQNAQLQAALHALTLEMQQLQQQAQAPPPQLVQAGAQLALCDATNSPQQQQVELRRLRKEVGRLKSEVQRLSTENNRLMEMSNALRADRNKQAAIAAAPPLVAAAHTPAYSVLPVPQQLWLGQGGTAAALPQLHLSMLAQYNPSLAAMVLPQQPQQQQQQQPPLLLPNMASTAPGINEPALPGSAAHANQPPLSPRNDRGTASPQGLGVVGLQVPVGSQAAPSLSKHAPAATAAQKAKQQQPRPPASHSAAKPKIRNYNIKDDSVAACRENLLM